VVNFTIKESGTYFSQFLIIFKRHENSPQNNHWANMLLFNLKIIINEKNKGLNILGS
jgi:hypothetical protein